MTGRLPELLSAIQYRDDPFMECNGLSSLILVIRMILYSAVLSKTGTSARLSPSRRAIRTIMRFALIVTPAAGAGASCRSQTALDLQDFFRKNIGLSKEQSVGDSFCGSLTSPLWEDSRRPTVTQVTSQSAWDHGSSRRPGAV